jgi:Putative esterase
MMPFPSRLSAILLMSLASPPITEPTRQLEQPPAANSIRFEISSAPGLLDRPEDGRLFVIFGRAKSPEPRQIVGDTGPGAPPTFARDATQFGPDSIGVIDETAVGFPIASVAALPAGDYFVQAVFARSRDLRLLNAPGNLHSAPISRRIDPAGGEPIRLILNAAIPAEQLPKETSSTKFLKIPSKLLSNFHGRPISLRAGVILPRDFDKDLDRRYPLRVHIGGYGSRYFHLPRVPNEPDAPRMVVLVLDGAGPLGDPYQINSDNHGPYGDAITQELIPHVEAKYRCIGKPRSRVLDGGSTGGWVALALQVFYPDFFNGAWASCPDSVDFRSFQLVNIYEDANAYVDKAGVERAAARDRQGKTRFTMRHECQLENVLGEGDSWTMSGGQWGAWNATYGPKGPNGRPVPIWDPKTGAIDQSVLEHWKKYDLRLILEKNWATLGPKLRGKLHIWVGEADDYFLNNAVHRLDDAFARLQPPHGGTIAYGPGQTHCWRGISDREMIDQMVTRTQKDEHND